MDINDSTRQTSINVSAYNNKLRNAFIAVAGIGFAIALPAELSKFIPSRAMADSFNNLTGVKDLLDADTFQYFKNHVKGMGQAIYYGQIANLGLMEYSSTQGYKARDLDAARYKDASFAASALLLAGGYVWEQFTALGSGQFDNTDMAWYAAGVAVLIGCNKLVDRLIEKPAVNNAAVHNAAVHNAAEFPAGNHRNIVPSR